MPKRNRRSSGEASIRSQMLDVPSSVITGLPKNAVTNYLVSRFTLVTPVGIPRTFETGLNLNLPGKLTLAIELVEPSGVPWQTISIDVASMMAKKGNWYEGLARIATYNTGFILVAIKDGNTGSIRLIDRNKQMKLKTISLWVES